MRKTLIYGVQQRSCYDIK